MKLHSQVAAAHGYSVGQILCIPIGLVFVSNFNPHNWEVFALSLCKKAEKCQSSPDLPAIAQKNCLIDLTKLPRDDDKCPHLLVQPRADRINKGVATDSK